MAVLYSFLGELNNSEPLHLEDGSRIRLTLLKDGSIHNEFRGVYFEMTQDVFATMWSLFSVRALWNTRMRFHIKRSQI